MNGECNLNVRNFAWNYIMAAYHLSHERVVNIVKRVEKAAQTPQAVCSSVRSFATWLKAEVPTSDSRRAPRNLHRFMKAFVTDYDF
jgi:hypothetical protein